MLVFKKYKMLNNKDYRPSFEKHNVLLIKYIEEKIKNEKDEEEIIGADWAYGRFTSVNDDMLDLTEEEINSLPKMKIPNISVRQCKELLIIRGRIQEVLTILDSVKDEQTKLILKNYWDNSQEYERDHKYLGLITAGLGMSEEDTDEFFIEASNL